MVRERRIARRVWYLSAVSAILLSTNGAYAKEVVKAASSGDVEHLNVLLLMCVAIGFVAIGALLVFIELDRRKNLKQDVDTNLSSLRQEMLSQISSMKGGPVTIGSEAPPESLEQLRKELIDLIDSRVQSKSEELSQSINQVSANITEVDSVLTKQVQEITGTVTKHVRQITESVAKHSQDASQSITKEVAETSETKFQNLRTEYKSALKAMAKVVDQQMTALQKSLADTRTELNDLICASKFIELLDDKNSRIDASIDLIRRYADEEKVVELSQRFPSTSVIHVLRLLSGKTQTPEMTDKLINSAMAVVDEFVHANQPEDAASVALQIIDAGLQIGLDSASLMQIVRKVAVLCKKTLNVGLTEHLHEQFVKLSSDGSGAVGPADLEEMMDLYKAVYPIEKVEDMHRRIHHCMQAFGKELDSDALSNLSKLADVLSNQSKFDDAKAVVLDIAIGLSSDESQLSVELPDSLQAVVARFIASDRLDQASEIEWRLFEAYQSKGLPVPAKIVLAELRTIAQKEAAKNQFESATRILTRRVNELKEMSTEKTQEIEALNDLAEIYLKSEQWELLAALAEEMIKTYKEMYGEHSEEVIERIAFAADVFTKIRKYDQATGLLEQGLVLASKVWGDYSEKTMALLNALADLYLKQARYSDAEVLFKRVLEFQEKGADPRMAKTYTSLGDTLALEKKYKEAEEFFKKSLDMSEATSGSDHPDVLQPLMRLAALYMTTSRYPDAEPCYKRILELKYKTLGEHSGEIITSLVHLGELYNLQSNFAESEVFFETALETAQRIYAHDDSRLADVMISYAQVLSQVGKSDEGTRLKARAERIKSSSMQKSDMDAQEVLTEH